ncbi:MAG: hypothetical protein NT061_06500 [Spirochaetes bacterium]|nr:hypothetical protein [Spirochaetota bacterium]
MSPQRKKVRPIAQAKSPWILAESKVKPGVVALFRLIAPLYFHSLLGFRSLTLRHPERLIDAYTDFFEGRTRLLIAFRHPYGDEAQLMAYLIGKTLWKEARRRGLRFPRRPHAHFVHGYEVPLWGGAFERWLLPRVGAIPVYHTKFNAASVTRIRSLMKDGEHPIALAPEGQVSYTSEDLPRLESGAVRICAWCVEDLAREGRPEKVVLLPISVHHRWDATSGKRLDELIGLIERKCGVNPAEAASRFDRLSSAADAILAVAERYYARFYAASLPRPGNPSRAERLDGLREAALSTAEQAFNLTLNEGLDTALKSDAIRRVYRIRQAGWDRIFRQDLPDMDGLPELEKALADRAAGEAWYTSRHMELVDLAWYLDFDRLKQDDPLELYVETAQNYYDLVSRLEGGNLSDRVGLRRKHAILVAGKPLSVTDRLSEPGPKGKAAIRSLNEELKRAFTDCIEEIREDRKNG